MLFECTKAVAEIDGTTLDCNLLLLREGKNNRPSSEEQNGQGGIELNHRI